MKKVAIVSLFIIAVLAIVGLNVYHMQSGVYSVETAEVANELMVQDTSTDSKELILLKKIVEFILSF